MALDTFNPYLFVSAGEQSNKFLTPNYADGIAKFQTQRAQSLTGLTVRIEGVQEGTGDPSPSNVRPISGRTGLTVTRAGKNLLANKKAISGNNIYLGTDVIGSPYYNTRSITLPAGTYTLSVETADGSATNLYAAKTGVQDSFARITSAKSLTFTLSETTDCYFWVYKADYSTVGVGAITQFQLELGSFATTYEPYAGHTYPITWQTEAGTIYGGTLDVVSGMLTVTHGYILLDGTQAIRKNGRTEVSQRTFLSIGGKAFGTTNIQSDRFSLMSAIDAVGKMVGRPAADGVEFYIPLEGTENTEASCKQWFADNNTQLVYELATPQTYQLEPEDVMTLAGFNQVYSNAGPVIDIKF